MDYKLSKRRKEMQIDLTVPPEAPILPQVTVPIETQVMVPPEAPILPQFVVNVTTTPLVNAVRQEVISSRNSEGEGGIIGIVVGLLIILSGLVLCLCFIRKGRKAGEKLAKIDAEPAKEPAVTVTDVSN